MSESILTSTKKVLGIQASDTSFDADVTMHINSVFSILNQLGLGPALGFMIEDSTAVWSDFLETDERLNAVKTLMYLRVRSLFDPPTTSYHIAAMEKQIQEFEWRLNTYREGYSWTNPVTGEVADGGDPEPTPPLEFIDGGTP